MFVLFGLYNKNKLLGSCDVYYAKKIDFIEFKNSREKWNYLVHLMRYPIIFCSWEWIYTWWKHYGKSRELFILFVYKENELKGILPLYTENLIQEKSRLKGRIYRYCGAEDLYPDHLDLICDVNDFDNCAKAIMAFMNSKTSNWDTIQFRFLSEISLLKSWIQTTSKTSKVSYKYVSIAPYLELSGSLEDYLKSFSSKKRYTIRKKEKKLLREKGLRYEVGDANNYAAILELLFNFQDYPP